MNMSEEERQLNLKAFFQSNALFGMKKTAADDSASSANEVTEMHDYSSVNSVSAFDSSINQQPKVPQGYHKASTFVNNDFELISDESEGLLAVIAEQNQSFEVSSTSNCKEKLSYAGSMEKGKQSPSPRQQVNKSLRLMENHK